MININKLYEKSALKEGENEFLFLTQIKGSKNKQKKNKQKINLSLAIDISTSMMQGIKNNNLLHANNINDLLLNNSMRQLEATSFDSKLSLAKKAAIKCVELLSDGDYLSIVAFDDKVSTIQNSIEINSQNRMLIINKINQLQAKGSTDLHAGWLQSATNVVENINEKSINRVLIISDGETNHGIRDSKEIINHVRKLYEQSVSTSCFGVGNGFNEDLLQGIVNNGGGNFYYIEKNEDFISAFENEFNGLSNLVGSEVKLKIELNNGKVIEQYNKFVLVDGSYLIQNIYSEKENTILFKLNTKVPKNISNYDLGTLHISYKDKEGKLITISEKLSIDVVSKKEWKNLEFVKEVKVQETLLTIANTKIEMTRAIDMGDMNRVNSLLGASLMASTSNAFYDERLEKETSTLNSTKTKLASSSASDLRKDISNQSYMTRYTRDNT